MSEELKPCPFCGGEADIEETSFMEHATFSVGCRSMEGPDECIGQQSLLTFARKSEAIAAWNRRASPIPEGGEEAREAAQRIVDWADNGKLADDEWLVERNETAIIAICRALLSSPRVEEVRREALEEAAKVVEPTNGPPCDCITLHDDEWWMPRCDCRNGGDADEAQSWCTSKNEARRIRALSPPLLGSGIMNRLAALNDGESSK